jgi:hypothetical protein
LAGAPLPSGKLVELEPGEHCEQVDETPIITDVKDHRSLASTLAPLLRESCDGRMGEISWFKADWQRGGAATGSTTYVDDDAQTKGAVLKLPVNTRELVWMRRLQDSDEPEHLPVPRLFAWGNEINGYDLRWVLMEKFEHGPLGLQWGDGHITRIGEAVARFHAAARKHPVDEAGRTEDWKDLLGKALESVRTNGVRDETRWVNAIKALRSRVKDLADEWDDRDTNQWLHGDVHLANAMSRDGLNEGSVSLIDLAEVHAGHWLEDAIYLERQLWARPERMAKEKPVQIVAKARKKHGLTVEEHYPRLAMIRRALLAGTAPKFIRSEGNPVHLAACLDRLEVALSELK